jgi:hypothetical protein
MIQQSVGKLNRLYLNADGPNSLPLFRYAYIDVQHFQNISRFDQVTHQLCYKVLKVVIFLGGL